MNNLNKVRTGKDIIRYVKLKVNGTLLNWSNVEIVSVKMRSAVQPMVEGTCTYTVCSPATQLQVNYSHLQPQYLGLNSLIITYKLNDVAVCFDVPAVVFVATTAEEHIYVDENQTLTPSANDSTLNPAIMDIEAAVAGAEAVRVSNENARISAEASRVSQTSAMLVRAEAAIAKANAAVGPQGPQGPAGPQGPQGPAGTIDNAYTKAQTDSLLNAKVSKDSLQALSVLTYHYSPDGDYYESEDDYDNNVDIYAKGGAALVHIISEESEDVIESYFCDQVVDIIGDYNVSIIAHVVGDVGNTSGLVIKYDEEESAVTFTPFSIPNIVSQTLPSADQASARNHLNVYSKSEVNAMITTTLNTSI